MNISAVSSLAQRSHDFDALQNTIKAGNLPGAQTAFAAFLQDVQKTQQMTGSAGLFGPGTKASRDLEALGGALKSANLGSAQKAMATLQYDIQAVGQSGSSLPITHVHHPLTLSEVANNGAPVIQAAANAPAIASILNVRP